jgi:putative transposase
MVRHVAEPGNLFLEFRQFRDLVIGREAARIAPVPLKYPLLKAEIVDEPARADRLAEQGFLFRCRVHAVAVCLKYLHAIIYNWSHCIVQKSSMSETDYRRGRSVVCALHVHLVFITKYRRDVLSDRCFPVLEDAFRGVCAEFDARLVEAIGEHDHVHLLIEYPPTIQLSKLVNSLKGVSSRRLRQRDFLEVKSKLWGNHLWSPSYFAASCGGAPLAIVKQYIESQRA